MLELFRSLRSHLSSHQSHRSLLLRPCLCLRPCLRLCLRPRLFLHPPLPVEFPLWCGGLQTLLLLSQLLAITLGLHRLRRGGLNTRYALIVGTGPRAQRVYRDIELHPAWGLKVIGFLDDADTPVDATGDTEVFHSASMPAARPATPARENRPPSSESTETIGG